MHKGSGFKIIGVPRRLSFDEVAKKYGLSKADAKRILEYVAEYPAMSKKTAKK